ncbi:hypothetical protein D3C71_1667630 [compost metagenome]
MEATPNRCEWHRHLGVALVFVALLRYVDKPGTFNVAAFDNTGNCQIEVIDVREAVSLQPLHPS